MFNTPPISVGSRLPSTQSQMQQPPQPPQSQNENTAKEKLANYVYEYLVHSGATKSAESFKMEVLANTQSSKNPTPCETGPGFLQNWWLVFWDLYCAAPERRDAPDNQCTQEAKFFYQHFVQPSDFPNGAMMNGMPPQFGAGPSMGMPGPEGMIPGFAGRFPPGRGPPGGPMPGGFGMFAGDPRMAQRLPPAAMRIPTSFPGMRPGGPPPPGQPGMPPFGRPQPFMDSPGGSFPPPGGMMPNGGVMCSQAPMSMSSPGPGVPPMGTPGGPPADPNNPDSRFMMLPTSSSAMPFGMGDQQMPHSAQSQPGSGTPQGTMSNGTPGMANSVEGQQCPSQQMSGLMNGEDMKQSPVSTPRGVNGTGTPLGGPGSQAPGSVQSQGAGGGNPEGGQAQGADGQPIPQEPAHTEEQMSEITKIKQSILADVQAFGTSQHSVGDMDAQFS